MTNESMLGRTVDESEFGTLDTFAVPASLTLTLQTEELQALCPAVEHIQPDIYWCEIQYVAVSRALETKSVKLWLTQFRDQRIFAEHLAQEMADKVASVDGIGETTVTLQQNVRGGIVTVVEATGRVQ